jgi:transcriptional regulator with XRE-family HTH domain
VHQLRAQEDVPPLPIMTGGELAEWRKSRGWSQAETAKVLGVGERTVRRAESEPHKPLGHSIRETLAKVT